MSDVHIIGAGIHPFGRTPDRTGLDQGVYAVYGAPGLSAVAVLGA